MIEIYHRGMFLCSVSNDEELCKSLRKYSLWFNPIELRYGQ